MRKFTRHENFAVIFHSTLCHKYGIKKGGKVLTYLVRIWYNFKKEGDRMETEENPEETEEKKRFREIYYSSLLQQRQENETNRIKIALISIGVTIAGVATTIKALEPFSNPLLLLLILIAGYAPWLYLLYVVFRKLKVDEEVIDEKIERIGEKNENEDPPSKKCADKLESRFHWSLIIALIGIICIPTFILISTLFIGGKEVSKKQTTKETVSRTTEKQTAKETVINTTDDRRSTHEQSYGGRLPGVFQAKPIDPNQEQEVTTPPVAVSDPQDTDSERQNQGNNQETETEQKK